MNKKILLVGLLSLVGVGVVTGCSLKNKITGGETGGNNTVTLDKKEAFNLEAATSLNLLSNLSSSSSTLGVKTLNVKREITDAEITKIKSALPTIDFILDNDKVFTSTISEEATIIEGVTYSLKEEIVVKNENLEDEKYVLVYNTTTLKNDVKDFDDDDDDDHDDHDDHDDQEVETKELLEGYAILGENKYKFESLSKSEVDSLEGETESERYFKIMVSNTSYVIVEQESETERNETSDEFSYKYVENGITKVDYSIEIEKGLNKDEIEYEVGGVEYELKRTVNANNETLYYVSIEDDVSNTEVVAIFKKVTDLEGNVSYEIVR